MIAGLHISQEIFAIDMLIALKSAFEHILQLLRRYGDQALDYRKDRDKGTVIQFSTTAMYSWWKESVKCMHDHQGPPSLKSL